MTLTINGKEEKIDGNGVSVLELLKLKDVEMPDMVSVQINGEILNRKEFEINSVRDKDTVEFLYFMGGGQRGGARSGA